MDQDKIHSLLSRQLKDIQAQADKILTGENSAESIEGFARYSTELKNFIITKLNDPEVVSIAKEIPLVNYKRNKTPYWQYLIFPYWWIVLYQDFQAKQKSMDEILVAKGKYSSLFLLIDHK